MLYNEVILRVEHAQNQLRYLGSCTLRIYTPHGLSLPVKSIFPRTKRVG
jgi:hypothetical protein